MDIPSESLFALLTDVRVTPALLPPSTVPDFPSLNSGDVVEIQGPSGSGKTELLYSFLATCILPAPHGWGKAAVLFDTEGSFDVNSARRVLLRAFSRSNIAPDAQLTATMCLNNLHVFFPTSTAQLAASIMNLPEYSKSRIADADIGIVAVDSLSAWYWQDRFTAEQLALPPSASTPLQHVLAALQAFRVSQRPVTILTNHGLTTFENYNKPFPVFYKQHLPSFPSLPAALPEGSHNVPSNIYLPLTHHVTLNPTPTPCPPLYCAPSLPNEEGNGREVVGYIRRPGCAVGRFLVDIRV